MIKNYATISAIILLVSCSGKSDVNREINNDLVQKEYDAKKNIQWEGSYFTTLPCADCPGIDTKIVLKKNETFWMSSDYQERDFAVQDSGTFFWDKNNAIINLKGVEHIIKAKVLDNALILLDRNGNEIDNDFSDLYIMKKQKDI